MHKRYRQDTVAVSCERVKKRAGLQFVSVCWVQPDPARVPQTASRVLTGKLFGQNLGQLTGRSVEGL